MDIASAPSAGTSSRRERRELLAWRWLLAAVCLFIISTIVSWQQSPGPVPAYRAKAPFSFLYPIEANPHCRLPRIPEALNAVYFTHDGQDGWAVGDGGRVLATTDGGIHWSVQASPTDRDLDVVVFGPDGRVGWAGIAETKSDPGAALLRTANGGARWERIDQPWNALPDGERAVVLSRPGTRPVLKPDVVRREPNHVLRLSSLETAQVFILDQVNAWRVNGLTGEIERTYDDGKSWITRTSPPDYVLRAVHMASDREHGWAVGYNGIIIATDDDWRTWHPQTANAEPELTDLWLSADGEQARAVGYDGTIIATEDGGRNWRPQVSGVDKGLLAVTFLGDGVHGWAAGEAGTVLATTDGGKRWTRLAHVTSPDVGDWYFDIVGLHLDPDGVHGRMVDTAGNRFALGANGKWQQQTQLELTIPRNIDMDSTGRSGWAVNISKYPESAPRRGELLKTEDGGEHWLPQPGRKDLLSVSLFGSLGLGVVDPPGSFRETRFFGNGQGLLARTTDSGASWRVYGGAIAHDLNAVKTARDGIHGLAVGGGGRILATDDGGITWHHAEQYRCYPALWYWLAVAMSLGLIWMAWIRRPAGLVRLSVAGMAASDAEVRQPSQDLLNFASLARGISRFLRNAETQPPLTLAVTGDWGSGKSSLMQLICADLRRFDHRPIWFNAWHHQKEEHLFAALLGAVYAQGAPPLMSLTGLNFRVRLLWLRSRRHFGVVLAMLGFISAACTLAWNTTHGAGVASMTAWVNSVGKQVTPTAGALSGLFAALAGLSAIIKGATPLRLNPAVLLGKSREHLSLKVATTQNDFRERFARQFEEVTRALPYKMVIIIDDLDRCRPGAVIEIMETVNYLTSAGMCFVIFGMAKERVTAALGLAFKDIAAELVQMERATGDVDAEDLGNEASERAKRHAYARDYLQKLVNIEIKVPYDVDHQHGSLLLKKTALESHGKGTLWKWGMSNLPLMACFTAIIVGSVIGYAGKRYIDGPETQPAVEVLSHTVLPRLGDTKAAQPAAPAASAPSAPSAKKHPSSVQREIEQGQILTSAAHLWPIGLGLLALLGITGLVALLVFRQSLNRTVDSPEFQEALQIWVRVIASYRATPRAIKRFCNRLRYLAMLQQGDEADKTVLDLIKARMRRWRRHGMDDVGTATLRPDALSEHQLIALGAMYEIFGDQWKQRMTALFPDGWQIVGGRDEVHVAHMAAIYAAAVDHQETFVVSWPPNPTEIAVFERLVSGVQLAGDPRTIDPRQAAMRSTQAAAK